MKNRRPHEAPLPEPIAYFLTWRTYGSWLPGDQRGWIRRSKGEQQPDEMRRRAALRAMKGDPVRLTPDQRRIVERAIRDHSRLRSWKLFAVNCRSNHVHVVIWSNLHPKEVMRQLKYWTTRRLNEQNSSHGVWWAERGSGQYLNDDEARDGAVVYTLEAQD